MRTVGCLLTAGLLPAPETSSLSRTACVGLEDKDRKFLGAFFRRYLSVSYLRGGKALVLSVIIFPALSRRLTLDSQ